MAWPLLCPPLSQGMVMLFLSCVEQHAEHFSSLMKDLTHLLLANNDCTQRSKEECLSNILRYVLRPILHPSDRVLASEILKDACEVKKQNPSSNPDINMVFSCLFYHIKNKDLINSVDIEVMSEEICCRLWAEHCPYALARIDEWLEKEGIDPSFVSVVGARRCKASLLAELDRATTPQNSVLQKVAQTKTKVLVRKI